MTNKPDSIDEVRHSAQAGRPGRSSELNSFKIFPLPSGGYRVWDWRHQRSVAIFPIRGQSSRAKNKQALQEAVECCRKNGMVL